MSAVLWRVMFLAEKYGRMTLTLDEVAEQIGLQPGTILNARMKGEFKWIRRDGKTLTADVADVSEYIEQREWRKECRSDRITGRTVRRPLERRQMPAWADRGAIKAIYVEAKRLTLETGVPHHVDHEIPLQGRLVSGLHVHNNLRVLTASENSRKCNRFEIE